MSNVVESSLVIERTYTAAVEELWDLWTTKEGFEFVVGSGRLPRRRSRDRGSAEWRLALRYVGRHARDDRDDDQNGPTVINRLSRLLL